MSTAAERPLLRREDRDGVVRLTAAQLQALLEGLDWRRVHAANATHVPVEAG